MIKLQQTFRDFRTQEMATVELEIDELKLFDHMRYRALRSKAKECRIAFGGVMCRQIKQEVAK